MNKEIRAAKESTVSVISEAFKAAKSVTVVEYRGLTVSDLDELRKALRESNSTFKVYKNTLVNIAVKELGYEGLAEHLEGPNAFVFSNNDEVSAPKAINKFAKQHEELVVKAGLVEGKVLNAEEIIAVSKLPGKDGLLSMFLSCLNAPISKFAATIKAVADKEASAN